MKRPVGVAKHLPGENDHVGLVRRHNLFGLHGLRDQANGTCGDSDAGADFSRKRRLVPRAGRNPGIGHETPAGAIDQVNTDFLETAR